jgi:hypothetical protein
VRFFGAAVLGAWVLVFWQIAISRDRQAGRLAAFAALFGSLALALANVAGAAVRPPTPGQVAAAIAQKGGKTVRCVEPVSGAYVCVYAYRSYCEEVEIVWSGGRYVGEKVVAARKGRCWKPTTKQSGPAA